MNHVEIEFHGKLMLAGDESKEVLQEKLLQLLLETEVEFNTWNSARIHLQAGEKPQNLEFLNRALNEGKGVYKP